MFVTTRTRPPATLPAPVLARIRHTIVANARRSVTAPTPTLQSIPRMGRGERFQEVTMYELMGRAHAALAAERGQGTVEYVGLILLLGVILAAVVTAGKDLGDDGIAKTIVNKLKGVIQSVAAPA